MATTEQIIEFFNSEKKEHSAIECTQIEAYTIIANHNNGRVAEGADHDIMYSCDVDKLQRCSIDELSKLKHRFHIMDEQYLATFV
jgi:hypothetical protein